MAPSPVDDDEVSLAEFGGSWSAPSPAGAAPPQPPAESKRTGPSVQHTRKLRKLSSERSRGQEYKRSDSHAYASPSSRSEEARAAQAVRTGEDVALFYAQYGQQSSVTFFYCKPADTGLEHRPYDLEVVPRESAGRSYITMSASGVVSVEKGVSGEFIGLGRWMWERCMFQALSKLSTFKHFLPRKVFCNWRKTVRKRMFNHIKEELQSKLFLAMPTFCQPLIELQSHLHCIKQVPFLWDSHSSDAVRLSLPASVDVVSERLSHQRTHNAIPAIESHVEQAQQVLERVCRDVTRLARLYQESIRDESELQDTIGVHLQQGRQPDKSRSMQQVKKEKIDRARTYHRVEHEAAMLGDFVRLADYMMVEAVSQRAITMVEELNKRLKNPHADSENAKGVFMTYLNFQDELPPEALYSTSEVSKANNDQAEHEKELEREAILNEEAPYTAFSPNREAVLEVVNEQIIEGMMSSLHSLPRFLFMSTFSGYLANQHSSRTDGLSPNMIIRNSEIFKTNRADIDRLLCADFRAAREYAQLHFQDLKPIYRFEQSWDPEEYAQEANRPLSEHKQNMKRHSDWQNELSRMRVSGSIGTMLVDSTGLKRTLQPIPENTLDAIKQVLINDAHEFTLNVLSRFESRSRALETRPSDLHDFVSFVQTVQDFESQQKQMLSDAQTVDDMYDLLRRYSAQVDPRHSVKHDDLHKAVQLFKSNLADARQFIDERTQSMLHTLQQRFSELNDSLLQLLGSLNSEPYTDDSKDAEEVDAKLQALESTVEQKKEQAITLQSYQRLFNMQQDDLSNLRMAEEQVKRRHKVWRMLAEFEANESSWLHDDVQSLDVQNITSEVERVTVESFRLGKQLKEDAVVKRLQKEVESFKAKLPLVEELGNNALKERHWHSIFSLVGSDFDPESSFSVRDLMEKGIEERIEEVQSISLNASKEYSLERAMEKLGEDWANVQLKIVPYKDTGTYVLADVEEIQSLLDDQMVKVQSMRASPFIKPFEERAQSWEDVLQTLQDLLDNWLAVQATWQYLEPIFSSEDIVKQMPEEAEKFQQVDQIYRELLERTVESPYAISIARDKSNLTNLQEANEKLDAVQKGLASYLELKRIAFSRFFFLSNDEMLEILSETKDPSRVQPHLSKCFEGISALTFEGEESEISSMHSIEGEAVPFTDRIKPAKARGAVEKWLVEVEQGMFDAMRDVHNRALQAYVQQDRSQWVLEWPGQAVIAISMVYWTYHMTNALRKEKSQPGSVRDVLAHSNHELSKIVDLVRGSLSSLNRITLGALVVMDVHARDVTQSLVDNGVDSESDFDWTSQLRLYWEEPEIRCSMMNASVYYGHEYLGNSTRLVITPLTDRCYRTLMGAIHLNYGGSPEGPAGTGKTETTKDLAKAIAIQCVVFNCSDSLDHLAMAKFFKGLAASGAWACFDEFNRIDLEVLSVVAQQVLEVQLAVKNKLKTFHFEGSEIPLRPTCNVFITMNPGYAGRSELPDNLKALFRTVAMMVPDYAQIAEILLYSSGYLQARSCAYKVVTTYKLCSEQLSSQDHYDYGMRAVMAVLKAAGNLKRLYPDEDEFVLMLRAIVDVNLCKFLSHDVPLFNGIVSDLFPGVTLPDPDYGSLPNALRKQCVEQNLHFSEYFRQKVVQLHDMITVRHGLMIVGPPFSGKSTALNVLASAMSDMKERQENGPLVEKVNVRRINPKAVTMGQLYGETDKATQEWKDGVLAVTFRHMAADQSNHKQWLVLDGPVDALWIENMNTVLDDNKKLCLPNSEIIKMSSSMSMIFEVADLAVASPATVSRCGMVYLEASELGWEPMFKSWLNTLPVTQETIKRIKQLFNSVIPALLRFVHYQCVEITPTLEINCVQSAMRLMKSLLQDVLRGSHNNSDEKSSGQQQSHSQQGTQNASTGADEAVEETESWQDLESIVLGEEHLYKLVDSIFVFSALWGLGSTTQGKDRAAFERTLRQLVYGVQPAGLERYTPTQDQMPVYRGVLLPGSEERNYKEEQSHLQQHEALDQSDGRHSRGGLNEAKLIAWEVEPEDSLFEHCFDVNACNWVRWLDSVPADQTEISESTQLSNIIVPTNDWALCRFMLHESLRYDFPLLFTGPTGTGKSVYVGQHVMALPKETFQPITVTFSARTSANMAQEQIDSALDKRRKGVYGPPPGKKAVVLVDDLNMPQKERYGAQPPIELLRQLLDMQGWYGRDNTFRRLQDVHTVCAMGPPGGGRTFITQRHLRHFSTIGLDQVSDERLRYIFHTVLDAHLTRGNFPDAIHAQSHNVINATLRVYNSAKTSLLPTPAKSHYTFNLRDFSSVVQGITLQPASALPESSEEQENGFLRLWVHETLRVFYDRLIDTNDMQWLLETLRESTYYECGGIDFDSLLSHLKESSSNDGGNQQEQRIDINDARKCIFGDYMDPEKGDPEQGEEPRVYEEVKDTDALIRVFENYLTDYNGVSKRQMNLAMFLFACEHVSRICRVLRQPSGHILLVGVGGSGRQSLTKLAAHVYHMPVHQVELSKQYGMTEWREDLKVVLRQAGAEDKELVFLFSDSQIKDEVFVEDLNNLLDRGEVPNMYTTEERMAILESARSAASKEGIQLESQLEQWSYFVRKCKANLHVVLAFSPMGRAFRERLRQFPSLVNCCTIDWFHPWPADALEAVAGKFLKHVEVENEKQRHALMEVCKTFHSNVRTLSQKFYENEGRYNYVTPTSYLELISTFETLLSKKRTENMRQKRRYDTGLEKINASAEQVANMQQELEALKPELVKKSEEVEERAKEIQKEKEEVVEPKKASVKEEEQQAEKQANQAKQIRDECDQELAEALPALNEAKAALDTIKPADINYMRNFSNPPEVIKLIMEAVCVLLDEKPAKNRDESGRAVYDYWKPSLGLLSQPDQFVSRLKEYDKDNIPQRITNKIRQQYKTHEKFTYEKAQNASTACVSLYQWVTAMDTYDKVAKEVAPKQERLKQAEDDYNEVAKNLEQKQSELQEVMDKLNQMESELQEATNRKQQLEEEYETTEVKLERAQKLINGLGDERQRWSEQSQALADSYSNLTGDILIASGIVAYLGTFTMQYRKEIVEQWVTLCSQMQIPRSSSFSLSSALGDKVKIREWHQAGLPNDSFSVDNGIIVDNARRWPLMIDPQSQANTWIRNMEKAHNLQVIKLSDGADNLRTLENAIQFGLPVLLENVGEELDPSLEPVLLKQTFKSAGVTCISLGDSTIEYSNDFRFYITTKLRNPHYLPETAVKVTLLNFMITEDGLADQLLGVLVARERPELEEQKNELVLQSAENKRRLKQIEDEILQVLSESEGNILDDERAINIITDAKNLGNEITQKQEQAERTEREIDDARRQYAPCGSYTAVIFFCISDLANVDPMYQYALAWFVNLFCNSIASSAMPEDSSDVSSRLENIKSHFTYSLYCNVCRSLFEKDKLLFAFSLSTRILQSHDLVHGEELMFLLTGGLKEPASPKTKPYQSAPWLTDRAWKELQKLNELTRFNHELTESVESRPKAWQVIYDSSSPHNERLPGRFEKELDGIARLCIVRCIRPDRLVPAIRDFVSKELGEQYAYAPLFDISACYDDSSPTTPLVFVLSPGSDPMTALLQFAESKGMEGKMNKISLGQGQGPKAAAMIQEGVKEGSWVVLQNCHLAPSWMPELDRICESLSPEHTHADFRLWMTSNPSAAFPITVLQNAVKMTMEPPKGLRTNLQRSYRLEPIANDDFFEGCKQPRAFKKLLFGLCFFHAVVQERRKFGPLGWNIAYGFDDSDLRISARQLRMFLDENHQIPLTALRYVTGECNYGGRVTDDKDRILLNTLLETVYTPEIYEYEDYSLSDSGMYKTPRDGARDVHERYIESLPMTPAPEAFGLHENADITKDQNDAYLMCNSLLAMQRSGGTTAGASSSGEDSSGVAAEAVHKMIAELPQNFDIEETQRRWPIKYEDSMNTVLTQEMSRFNKLLDVIRSSLENIYLALAGKVVMSSDVDAAYREIAVNKVPELWKSVSYPTLMPLGSYFKDLLQRLEMLRQWDHHGQPTVFWLSGFFFVQSFLTATLQNFARKYTVPIDDVAFQYNVLGTDPSEYTRPPSEGVLVHGIFIEGCGWDSKERKLCEPEPKQLVVKAPVFWLQPKQTKDISHGKTYACPLYRTKERKGTLSTTGMHERSPFDECCNRVLA